MLLFFMTDELHKMKSAHEQELAEMDALIAAKKARIEELERQNKLMRQALFGSKSEKRQAVLDGDDPHLPFDGAAEVEPEVREEVDPTPRKRRKKSSNKLVFPMGIPVEEIELDVPEDEKKDPVSGKAYSIIGEESIERLAHVPASFKLLRYRRPVYGCKKDGVHKMDLPLQLIPGGLADATILADLLVKRFCDHLPFYRQSEAYARQGFKVSRQTLDKWFLQLSAALKPLGKLLLEEILNGKAIHMDETSVKLQVQGKGKTKTAYMWLLCGHGAGKNAPPDEPPLVYFHFEDNRDHVNVPKLLGRYNGVLHSDAYGAYEDHIANSDVDWAPCWAHARRKFIEATDGAFKENALQLIGKVFVNEREIFTLTPSKRLAKRKLEQKPLIDELIRLLIQKQTSVEVMTSKSLGIAVNYILKRKQHFKAFLENSDMHIHNNAAERAVRPMTIGRKNWLFIGSKDGGEGAATIYSLLQTCRRLNIEPQTYLTDVLRRLPYIAEENLNQLLPHNWTANPHKKSAFLPAEFPLS